MIPKLTLNLEKIKENWKNKEDQEHVIKICTVGSLGKSKIPVLTGVNNSIFLELGVFNECRKVLDWGIDYGYADTEEVLSVYLKKYLEGDKRYLITTDLMPMDWEKYYKNGSYINKDGVNTEDDYYPYIREHPDMMIPQEHRNYWIQYTVSEIE